MNKALTLFQLIYSHQSPPVALRPLSFDLGGRITFILAPWLVSTITVWPVHTPKWLVHQLPCAPYLQHPLTASTAHLRPKLPVTTSEIAVRPFRSILLIMRFLLIIVLYFLGTQGMRGCSTTTDTP